MLAMGIPVNRVIAQPLIGFHVENKDGYTCNVHVLGKQYTIMYHTHIDIMSNLHSEPYWAKIT